MTNIEKLTAIRARCMELLAIAEKRTPGKWYAGQYGMAVYSRHNRSSVVAHTDYPDGNAAFIAACAGAAEAGWRTTIVAIDWLDRMGAMMGLTASEQNVADKILTAWEDVV